MSYSEISILAGSLINFLTLLVLVFQTRSLSNQTRMLSNSVQYGTYQQLLEQLNDVSRLVLTNSGARKIFAEIDFIKDSLARNPNLSTEKIALAWLIINRYEAAFVGNQLGVLPTGEWKVWEKRLAKDMRLSFMRDVWDDDAKNFDYNPGFKALMQDLRAAAAARPDRRSPHARPSQREANLTSSSTLRLILLILALPLLGCATGDLNSKHETPATAETLWHDYCAAVAATKFPTATNLSHQLVAITHSSEKLQWKEGKVLMATLAKNDCEQDSSFCATQTGKSVAVPDAVWLTAVPALRDFCSSIHGNLELRLLQRLGMPPSGIPVDVMVQMWVSPKDMFRPCADPEISDGECQLNLTPEDDKGEGCPWTESFEAQTSARFTEVKREHIQWMCANWAGSYPPSCGSDIQPIPFPWTGLGYTWDWAPENPDHRGESEFVIPAGTTVTIESVTGLEEYCKAQ